jgi:hypothetical protein
MPTLRFKGHDRHRRHGGPRSFPIPGAREVLLVGCAMTCLLLSLIFQAGTLRYAAYASPAFLLAYLLSRPKAGLLKRETAALITALTILLTAAVASGHLSAFSYVVFILAGLLPIAVAGSISWIWLYALLLGLTGCEIYLVATAGFSLTSLLSSENATESASVPFLSGLLVGTFVLSRKFPAAAISLLLALTSGKRIVLGAVAVGLVVSFLRDRVRPGPPRLPGWKITALQSLGVTALFVLALNMPDVLQAIAAKYHVNNDVFSAGRIRGQELGYDAFFNSSVWQILFGHGLGAADNYSSESWGEHMLTHSDYLRQLIDLGAVGSFLFSLSYLILVGRGKMGFYVVGYTTILWLTDNTLIYTFYAVGIALVVLASRHEVGRSAVSQKRRGPLDAKIWL